MITEAPVVKTPDYLNANYGIRSWLLTVASRRLVDEWRSESARRRREETDAVLNAIGSGAAPDHDDTLTLLFLCCHPALSAPSQLALTLRAVGGLTTAEIANAFLIPEATMAQRISRAKQSIKAAGAAFDLPPAAEREERLQVVMQVLYLVFNEGYTDVRADLAGRDARHLAHRAAPSNARRNARCRCVIATSSFPT